MGKLKLFFACSIDGYIAKRNGDVAWLERFSQMGEDYGYMEFMDDIDVVVIGRKSYEKVLGFAEFPYSHPCYVITSREEEYRDPRVTFSDDLFGVIGKLLKQNRSIYVDGGANIISQLIKGGFVDEMTITTLPLILGSGIRLFKSGIGESEFKLNDINKFASGLIQAKYSRVNN